MTEAVLDRSALRADVFAAVEALRVAERLDGARPVWISLAGPRIEPRALLSLLGDPAATEEPEAVVWENAEESFCGWGVASSIRVDGGPDRFAQVRRQVDAFDLDSCLVDEHGGVHDAATKPRWFGGFSFETELMEERSPWLGFGAGWFVLPQLAVRRSEGRTTWSFVIDSADADRPSESEAVILLSWLWDRVEAGLAVDVQEPQPEAMFASPTAPREFEQNIESAVDSIRLGTLEKVVAAAHVDVDLDHSPPLDRLMASWSAGALESTRFLFRRRGEAFLGATPERLVRKAGRLVQTSALAGTAPKDEVENHARGGSGAGRRVAARLLSSAKNRREHDFVVRHLVERLDPLCSSLRVSDELSILELRDLLHLQTPIEGELERDHHVLELVEALHPTPAVCGFPTASARRWIGDHEEVGRGWYSGPVGWLDTDGDGDFQVALRSMLLSGRGSGYEQARLYAGVGLVRDSRVHEEMDEVDAKLLTAGRALGPWIRAERLLTAERRTDEPTVEGAAVSEPLSG